MYIYKLQPFLDFILLRSVYISIVSSPCGLGHLNGEYATEQLWIA